MTQQNHRKNVWITPETHAQLIAIGRAHGAAEGREASPGIRVSARYHGRLVEQLKIMIEAFESEVHDSWDGTSQVDNMLAKASDARLLLREIEVAG